jgi:hypothetical protein
VRPFPFCPLSSLSVRLPLCPLAPPPALPPILPYPAACPLPTPALSPPIHHESSTYPVPSSPLSPTYALRITLLPLFPASLLPELRACVDELRLCHAGAFGPRLDLPLELPSGRICPCASRNPGTAAAHRSTRQSSLAPSHLMHLAIGSAYGSAGHPSVGSPHGFRCSLKPTRYTVASAGACPPRKPRPRRAAYMHHALRVKALCVYEHSESDAF